jgi:hypothetical protein
MPSAPTSVRPDQRNASATRFNPLGQAQPMEKNIMLIVSDETYDKTAAESVKPSSENRPKEARSGEMVRRVVGRI